MGERILLKKGYKGAKLVFSLRTHVPRSIVMLLLIVLVCEDHANGQRIAKSTTFNIKSNIEIFHVLMDGYLDGENTFTYPSTKSFEPMKSLSLENNGLLKVEHPRLVINNKRNWFTIQTMVDEIFAGETTDKEKELATWKFIKNNRIHRFEAERTNEVNDPIKLFGVYGYGMCYNTNYASTFLAKKALGSARSFSPMNGRHFVSGLRFDDDFVLVDGDIETFYLKSDNQTLANYDDIVADKNLIRRVHHYGKNEPYNLYNDYVAESVYEPNATKFYLGQLNEFHSLDFSLRPGEKIIYTWDQGRLYHSLNSQHNAQSNEIANGKFVYSLDFGEINLNELVNGFDNVEANLIANDEPKIHPKELNRESFIIIKIASPFVILDSKIVGSFVQNSINDSIEVLFSKDSSNWVSVLNPNKTGVFKDSVELFNQIGTLTSEALYNYYLKFSFSPQKNVVDCGLDSLVISTDFQVSRSFLPSLHLGDNVISYSDENLLERNLELRINWEESSENTPPEQIDPPIFPADDSVVDSLKFTFKWASAIDEDPIADYEFELSDRADMKYPLSPSFQIYTSQIPNLPINEFQIPFNGLLNSGVRYYWRVRAKDSKGAWSSWSPVWSFIPLGVMPPLETTLEIKDDEIVLNWKPNSGGLTPRYYEVYASNEWLGFTPNKSYLIDTTSTNRFIISLINNIPKTFYRIIAVGSSGQRSGLSNVAQTPYPYSFHVLDTLTPLLEYKLNLKLNKLRTREIIQVDENVYWNTFIDDTVSVDVVYKPKWLSFHPSLNQFVGTVDYSKAANQFLSDSLLVKVKYRGSHSNISNMQTIRIPFRKNRIPVAGRMDSLAAVDDEYIGRLEYNDPDIFLGDYIKNVEILNKPSWIKYEIDFENKVITFYGTPKTAEDAIVRVRITDSANEYVEKSLPIKVGLGRIQLSNKKFSVFPNPFENELEVVFLSEVFQKLKITIFDIMGKKAFDLYDSVANPGIFRISLDTSVIPPGVYLIRINTETNCVWNSYKIIRLSN